MIKSFRDLEVYRESLDLSLEIEVLVRIFPREEKFLTVDQMRRASRGIPPLIAEGYAKRQFLRTFQKYINDAIGEANEMIAHLEIAGRLGYCKNKGKIEDLTLRYDKLGKKLTNLKNNWQNFK